MAHRSSEEPDAGNGSGQSNDGLANIRKYRPPARWGSSEEIASAVESHRVTTLVDAAYSCHTAFLSILSNHSVKIIGTWTARDAVGYQFDV